MKIKLDENLPESLVDRLTVLGHDVDTVRLEGFAGREDAVVWQAAQSEGRFLVTQDLDFSDVRKFPAGTHCGIMLVRLPDAGRLELNERVGRVFELSDTCDWEGGFIILSRHKLRIVLPNQQDGPSPN